MSGIFCARQYGILLRAGIGLSLTGSRGAAAGAGEDGSRHLLGASYSLTFSTLLACLILQSATPAQYCLVTFTFSMIFTATAVIGELAGGLFHPLDLSVTGHLPISGFTRFSARFSELFFTLVIITLNLNLTPALLFHFKTQGSVLAPFVFLAASLCAALFTAGACLVIYILLARFLSASQFQGFLLHLNVFLSLAVIGLMINIGRLLQSGRLGAAAEGDWPYLLPSAWFAGMTLEALGLPGGEARAVAYAAVSLAVSLVPLFFAAFGTERWLRVLAGGRALGRARSAPGFMMRLFERLFVRPEEKASFEFTAVNLARDRGFRLKAYPILGVPIMMMTFTLFDEGEPLFFIFMLQLMNLYLPLVLSFLPFGDHFQAGWIFDALPVKGIRDFSRGVEKAFIFRIALPLMLLNILVLALVWSPLEGVLNAFYAFWAGLFVVGLKVRTLSAYPFTREFRGAVMESFAGALVGILVVLALLGWIQYLSRASMILFSAQIAAMILLHKVRCSISTRSEVDPA